MKYRGCEIGGSGCDNFNVVCSLIDVVNEAARDRAFDEYLKGDAHAYCRTAVAFEEACDREIRKIKAGRPSPRHPFFCCHDCFVELLSTKPQFTYTALDTELDENDEAWNSVPIEDAPDECDIEALEGFLVSKCHAEYVTTFSPASEDCDNRKAYLDSLRELLRLAARLAKRLGEKEAAKNLLEALCLTLRDTSMDFSYTHAKQALATTFSRETAEEICSAATLGWRQLWAGVEYAALKPLSPKKASKRKS